MIRRHRVLSFLFGIVVCLLASGLSDVLIPPMTPAPAASTPPASRAAARRARAPLPSGPAPSASEPIELAEALGVELPAHADAEARGFTARALYGSRQGSGWSALVDDLEEAGEAELAAKVDTLGFELLLASLPDADADLQGLAQRERALAEELHALLQDEELIFRVEDLEAAAISMAEGAPPDGRWKLKDEQDDEADEASKADEAEPQEGG